MEVATMTDKEYRELSKHFGWDEDDTPEVCGIEEYLDYVGFEE